VCVLLSFVAIESAAQTVPRRLEVGAVATVADLTVAPYAGVAADVDVNLSPILAIQAQVAREGERGWWNTKLGVGMRATFIRREQWLFYGGARPGWSRISAKVDGVSIPPAFVLDLTAGLGVRVRRRFLARFELERDIFAARPIEIPFLSSPPLVIDGRVGSHWNLKVSAAYTFGACIPAVREPSATAGPWVVGMASGVAVSTGSRPLATLGGFFSRRLNRFVDFDNEVSASITSDLPAGFYEGGRLVQALSGIKLGVRDRRLGVFFKLRGGVTTWSHSRTASKPNVRQSGPAIDLGGVIEYAVSPTAVFRIDVGETVSLFTENLLLYDITVTRSFGSSDTYTLPIRLGVGFRF
jgi:hypothetical protein